jgi:hypothetical protein
MNKDYEELKRREKWHTIVINATVVLVAISILILLYSLIV